MKKHSFSITLWLAILLVGCLITRPGQAEPLRLIENDFQSPLEASQKIGQLSQELRSRNDRRGLFAGIYSLTIQSANLRLGQHGFQNPAWVERLIVNYANLYRRTILAELRGQRATLPRGWQMEFQYIEDTLIDAPSPQEGLSWSPDLDVVFGIHVHIKRDLVEALWTTGFDPKSLSQRQDFLAITDALAQVFPKIWNLFMNYETAFHLAPQFEQNTVMNWIAALRLEVWGNAIRTAGLSTAEKKKWIENLDEQVARDSYWKGIFLPLLSEAPNQEQTQEQH